MPREVFVAGQILTAAEMNTVSDQTVMSFAGTAARGSAIPSPTEGMAAYLNDSNIISLYDGSAWKTSVATTGGIIAVKSAIFTGTQTASVTTGSNVAVTDLSITHEVADPANKLIIMANIGAAGNSEEVANVGLQIDDGSGLIATGDSPGSRVPVSAGGYTLSGGATWTTVNLSTTFVHTPGAGSKTYTVKAANVSGFTRTLYINRSQTDGNNAAYTRAISSLVIMEVAA